MRTLRVKEVRDLTFGRHVDRTFEGFDAPFVVVHGPNESGKSTLAEFLVWAIGGPWMVAREASAFRGNTDGNLKGVLRGALGDDGIDLDARFRLKLAGVPNDLRKGSIGTANVDAKAIARNLGSLTPNEYQLIYRLYGASLGDVGSADAFSDLFTKFALGSSAAVSNPRKILRSLGDAARKLDDAVKGARKTRRDVDAEIREVSQIPEEIASLTREVDELGSWIADAVVRDGQLRSRRSVLQRARSGIEQVQARDAVRAKLDAFPELSNEWSTVAENVDEIQSIVGDMATVDREASEQEASVDDLVRRSGLDRAALAVATLTLGERDELAGAVRGLVAARQAEADAAAQIEQSSSQRADAKSEIDRLRRALGVDESVLGSLDRLGPVLSEVQPRIVLWKSECDKVVDAERADAVNGAGGDPARPGAPGSFRLWIVLAAIVGAGALSALHWIAGLVAAVGAASLAFAWRTTTGLVSPAYGAADAARQRRTEAAAGARAAAAVHKQMIDEVLGALSGVITHPDSAAAELDQLRELSNQRSRLVLLDGQIERGRGELRGTQDTVSLASDQVSAVFAPRKIPLSVAGEHFDQWLAVYRDAIDAVAAQSRRVEKQAGLARRISELVLPVRDELSGLSPVAIRDRVEAVHRVLQERRGIESQVRDAQLQVAAASLDSAEIRELLQQYPTAAELDVQIDESTRQIDALRAERDGKIAECEQKRTDISTLEQTDRLQGLLLQEGLLDEEIEESVARKAAADLAVKVLTESIDAYERDNQDPVVATATDLIARVVPDWGTVILSRDDDGTPVLKRSSTSGSVHDRAISDGGRALLYLGIRLAFALKDAERRSIALPIICDDPLVHFDDERRASAISLLHERSALHQVLLFTCDDDTRDRAAALGASVVQI